VCVRGRARVRAFVYHWLQNDINIRWERLKRNFCLRYLAVFQRDIGRSSDSRMS